MGAHVSGIIATNTTIDYSRLAGAKDFGGISGRALREKSYQVLQEVARAVYGKTILVSAGGIDIVNTGYNSFPTIELTWALILSAARNILNARFNPSRFAPITPLSSR